MKEKNLKEHKDYEDAVIDMAKDTIEDLLQGNTKSIQQLKNYYKMSKVEGNSMQTLKTKIRILKYLLDYIKKDDFKNFKRSDIEKFILHKSNLNPSTLNLYKIHIKTFYARLYKKLPGQYPKVVEWLETKNHNNGTHKRKEILSKIEIKEILNATDSIRDKCLISILYDGALRIGEACNLKIKDCYPDEYGYTIIVNGKTGERKIRLVNAVPHLKHWLNIHPYKDNIEKNVFICLSRRRGEPLLPIGGYKIIEKAVKKSNIQKKVYPHIFRHSKLTHLTREGFSESELRLFAGWGRTSNMADIYIHNNYDSVDKKIREKNNLVNKEDKKKKEKEDKSLQPITCPMCEETNDPDNSFCVSCGQILDNIGIKTLGETTTAMTLLMKKDKKLTERLINEISKEVKEKLLLNLK